MIIRLDKALIWLLTFSVDEEQKLVNSLFLCVELKEHLRYKTTHATIIWRTDDTSDE